MKNIAKAAGGCTYGCGVGGMEQQDEAELLEQVHAIKGLTGTLGITGLFEQSAAIGCALTCRNARRAARENDVIKTGVGPRL